MSLISTEEQKKKLFENYNTAIWNIASPSLIGGTAFAEDQDSPFLIKGSTVENLLDMYYILVSTLLDIQIQIDVSNIESRKTELFAHAKECRNLDSEIWDHIISDLEKCM